MDPLNVLAKFEIRIEKFCYCFSLTGTAFTAYVGLSYKLIRLIDTTINTCVQFVLLLLNTEALDRLRVHSNMYLVLMSILICVHITATVQNSSNMVVVEASVHAPTTPVQSTPTSLMSTRTVVAQTPCVPPPSSSSRLCQRSVGETANFCCSIIYLYLYLSLLLWPRHGQYCLPTQNV